MSVAKAKLVDNDEEELEQGDDNFLMQDRKTDRKLIGVLLTTFSGGIAAGIIAASMATVYMYHYGFNQYESPHGPFATKNGFPVYENVRMGIALYHVLASFLCLLPGCSFLSTIEKKTSVAARKTCIVSLILSSIWFLAGAVPGLFMLLTHAVYPVLFFTSFLSLLQLIITVVLFFMSCKLYSTASISEYNPVGTPANKMLVQ